MYGKMQSLGSLKSFIWYAPQLSRASILCFLILSLLRVHHWGWLQWLTVRWGANPTSILSFLRAHHWGGCNVMVWWLQNPLFTDTAGGIFSSHCFHHSSYFDLSWNLIRIVLQLQINWEEINIITDFLWSGVKCMALGRTL